MEETEAIDETGSAEKLANARKLFEEAVDHTRESHVEAHRAERFYHNTRLEGQWESADLAYLKDQGRPAFSFNITKDKVDSFLGLYADAQRTPTVVGSGSEDKLLAEAIEIVKENVLQDARYERKSAAMLKTGTIAGECCLHVEVAPSSKGKGWLNINIDRILPFEVHWDAGSMEADRCDARHVFWDRWLTKAEFKEAYPDHAGEWGSLSERGDTFDAGGDSDAWGEEGPESYGDRLDDYGGDRGSHYYYDRQKHKARVIRYEYKTTITRTYATDLMSGQREEIEDSQVERVQMAIDMGAGWELDTVKDEVVKVCEFIGAKILAEYDSPGPFDGFSIVPYIYMMDEEEGVPYGLVRNLFDPQMELNKSKSLEIEYIAQATAPGTIAEVDAVVDEEQFMAEIRRPGGLALVKRDQLDRVRSREPAAPSMAVTQRAISAVELLDKISGIPSSGMDQPASQAEAATTVALRYHKSRQVVQDPIANYEHAQHEIVRRVVETIARAMPDDQIQAILGNDQRFQVGNGVIVEMQANPQQPDGEWIPKARASLREMRSLDWNIELEHSSENSTLRMMEFDMLLKLATAGVPVDPEVMVETSTGSRSQRERLKAFVESAQASQAAQAQAESAAFAQQMEQAAQIQMLEGQEKARHNQATEALEAAKAEGNLTQKLLELWEKADQAEKGFILSQMQLGAQASRGV